MANVVVAGKAYEHIVTGRCVDLVKSFKDKLIHAHKAHKQTSTYRIVSYKAENYERDIRKFYYSQLTLTIK